MDRFNKGQRFWGVVILGVGWGTVAAICSLRIIKSLLLGQVPIVAPLILGVSVFFLICLHDDRLRLVGLVINLGMLAAGWFIFILAVILAAGLDIKIPNLGTISLILLVPGMLNSFLYNSTLAGNQAFQEWKEKLFP